MSARRTIPYRYVGGMEAVTVYLPSGRALTVARGESVDLLPNEADALAGHPEFQPAEPRKAAS